MPGREATLGRVSFPDPLVRDGVGRVLIVDPVADKLAKGDPTMGWEGDERLALYINPLWALWEIWRLEHDNVMRLVMRLDASRRGPEVVALAIAKLVQTDTRRGFDVTEAIDKANRDHEAAKDKKAAEVNEEFADRLGHALVKDGLA